MATKFGTVNGAGTGDGSTWGNAVACANFGTGMTTLLAACSNGDTIKLEAGPGYVATSTVNWNKRITVKGETQAGADARAIISGNRSNPWPANGVWTDGKTVGGVTYPTLTAATIGSNVFAYKELGAGSGGSVFSWLAFRDVGTPIQPAFTSAAKTGQVTVNDCVTFNTNGLVYVDASASGSCDIVANRCRSVGYSEGMFRAFGKIIATDCHGDARNQFHSPTTNLFGAHTQDNSRTFGSAASPGVTLTASSDQVTFSPGHSLLANDPIIFAPLTGGAPIATGVVYYVKTVVSSTVLTLSTTPGGALLDITADGTAWGLILTLSAYDTQYTRCSFINHSAAPPAGSSQDPAITGNYQQGDGIVAEENTNWLPSTDIVVNGNYDRGIDIKCAIPLGNLRHVYAFHNGFDIAAHNDTVETYVSDSWLGTTFRTAGDTGNSSNIQASGHLHIVRCVLDQRTTGSSSQFYAAYGSVQPAHGQAGVQIAQRVGAMFVNDSLINLKSGLTKALNSTGGAPPTTPTYTETNVTTVTV